MPVRGPCGCGGFWGTCAFLLFGVVGGVSCLGEAPYFSNNCWVELYLVASFSLLIVASRSLFSLAM